MATHQFIVLTAAQPGQEAEFDRWYDEQHLPDVVAVPGVVKASRFRVLNQGETTFASPAWRSVALYEIEGDDPSSVIDEINARSATAAMPLSEALDANIYLPMLAEHTRSIEQQQAPDGAEGQQA